MKKIILLSLTILLCAENISAQSQGPNNPGTASYSVIGCLVCPGSEWNNYNNIMAADGMYATINLAGNPICFQTNCYYSRFLMAFNFGFTIPATAVITGVKTEMLRMTAASNGIIDTIAQLYTPGSLGTNHNSPMTWTPNPTNIVYGSSSDLWGMTLTPDTVNLFDFGFRVMIKNGSATTSLSPSSVDHIKMTVYYSLSTGTFSQTRTAGNFSPWYSQEENALVLNDFNPEKIFSLSVFDVTGRTLCNLTPASSQTKFFFPHLSPGVYFAVLRTEEKTTALKFVVSK